MIPAGTGDGDEFAEWDAAYVLGALSPSDRRAYERHLAECDACRAAVADLAVSTGAACSAVFGERPEAERRCRYSSTPGAVGTRT